MKIVTKSYKRNGNGRDSKIYFEVAFDEYPESKDIAEAQIELGFDPGGYGGMMGLQIKPLQVAEGLGDIYIATWSCFGSCD